MKEKTVVLGLFMAVCAMGSAQEILTLDNPEILTSDVDKQGYGYGAVFSNDTLFVSGTSTMVESVVDAYVMTSDGAKKIGTIREGGVKNRLFFGSKIFASGGRLGVLASTKKYFYLYEKSATGVSVQPVDSISRSAATMYLDMAGQYYVTSEKCTLMVKKLVGNKHENVFARGTNVEAPCAMDGKVLCYVDTELDSDKAVADTVLRIVEDPEEAFKSFDTLEKSISVVSLAGYGGFSSLPNLRLDINGDRIVVGMSSLSNRILVIDKLSTGWTVTSVIDKQPDVENFWGFSLCLSDKNTLAIGCNRKGDNFIYKCIDGEWKPSMRLVSDYESGWVVACNGRYFVTTNNVFKGENNDMSNAGCVMLYDLNVSDLPISDIRVDDESDSGEAYDLYGRKVDDTYKGLTIKGGRLILKK